MKLSIHKTRRLAEYETKQVTSKTYQHIESSSKATMALDNLNWSIQKNELAKSSTWYA